MTTKQEQRIRVRISKIKKALSDDKKHWGGYYHDGQGLRYLLPELYLKIKDYKGALNYFRWFTKAFPDDIGFPFFLFEWTITLFKTGKIKDAEKKALESFIANTYLIDQFLGKELLYFDKWEGSSWEHPDLVKELPYNQKQKDLLDFTEWLNQFVISEKFYKIAREFIDIAIQLKVISAGKNRTILVNRQNKLLDDY
jgi:tetratricopeptide (TPR) repeat protein